MTPNLSPYNAIATGLFVKAVIGSDVLLISDYNQSVTINGDTYIGLGEFVGISATTSELKSSSGEITIKIGRAHV